MRLARFGEPHYSNWQDEKNKKRPRYAMDKTRFTVRRAIVFSKATKGLGWGEAHLLAVWGIDS